MRYNRQSYQHKLDCESLLNLRGIKWFERLSKYLVADDLERDFYLLNLVDNVLMKESDFPKPLEFLSQACDILGVHPIPKLFLDTNPAPHSICIGEQAPLIVLSSGLLDLLSDDELAAAIAHEVGHIACGHAYYKLLAENFSGLSQLTNSIPGVGIAALTAKIPLFDWYRKADLSADRAALLVMGESEPVLRMIGKIAGGSNSLGKCISLDSLLDQAKETRRTIKEMRTGNLKQKTAYFFSNIVMQGMLRTQPWPAIRIFEVLEWTDSGAFEKRLNGQDIEEPQDQPDAGAEERSAGFFQTWTNTINETTRYLKSWSAKNKEAPDDKQDPH